MNYALTSNHLSRSIHVNLLDYLKLRLNLLLFLLYKEDRLLPHKENGPLAQRRSLVKVDVNIPKVKFDWVQLAVSSTIFHIASSIVFFFRASFTLPPSDEKSADL